MRYLTLLILFALASYSAMGDPVPSPVYGVTIDSIDSLRSTKESLRRLSRKPTTRVVFDEYVPAEEYKDAVEQIHGVSYVMGEILDSFYVKDYSVPQYRDRVSEYLDTLGDSVDIWEIGNEINGEWLGDARDVSAKLRSAYDVVKSRGKTTALTLYYNQGCWERESNEMFRWAAANIPAAMRNGLDYVWVSYYEDDCEGLQPDWNRVFQRVGELFPNSKIGVGECGTKYRSRKTSTLRRYYRMKINHPRYVGGYFWWYYKQDMVPYSKSLWRELNSLLSALPFAQ